MSLSRPSYRFALSPRWLLLHLLVVVSVIVMVNLGLWQLRRLDGRRAANRVIDARLAEPPVPLAELVSSTLGDQSVSETIFRRVTVAGEYRSEDEVLVRNRTLNGAAGYWVVTPLVLHDGTAIAVNRGWIPVALADSGDKSSYAAPNGAVSIQALVRETERRSGLGVADPASGRLDTLSRLDVDRLDAQVPYDLLPVWVQLEQQDPSQGNGVPVALPLPERNDGPHLNYAGQWFIFATLTVIVYPLVLRQIARSRSGIAIPAGQQGDVAADNKPTSSPITKAAPAGDHLLSVQSGSRRVDGVVMSGSDAPDPANPGMPNIGEHEAGRG
ncbi:MAG: SURF1 family protein [Acidimicrobiales bacterium]|nr:SURF1 family protein [Acidimicrobiales bacterium]